MLSELVLILWILFEINVYEKLLVKIQFDYRENFEDFLIKMGTLSLHIYDQANLSGKIFSGYVKHQIFDKNQNYWDVVNYNLILVSLDIH